MAKNYYAILGVSPSATSEDIRGAYRRRAKELHPDHYGENSTQFLDVQEAYSVLGDPAQRRNYDRSIGGSRFSSTPSNFAEIETLKRRTQGAEPLRPKREPMVFRDISLQNSFRTSRPSMEEIFDRIWGNFSLIEPFKGGRLQNLCLEVILSPEEAQRGGRFQIFIPARIMCPACRGSGAVGPYECFRCRGRGAIIEDLPVAMEFAPGVSDGYQKAISLNPFGIRDVYLTLIFRIDRAADIEDL
jgi:molecular chaperone DnaJ